MPFDAQDRRSLLETRLGRRSLLKFAAASVSVASLGTLLAACGDDDDEESGAGAGAGSPGAVGTSAAQTTSTTSAMTTRQATEASGTPLGAPPTGGGQTHMIEMTADNKFVPDQLTLRVGDTVTWRIVGAMPHSSTCDPGEAANPEEHVKLPEGAQPWDSGILTAEGDEYSQTFDVAGDYTYFCIPHEQLGMIGNLTVEDA